MSKKHTVRAFFTTVVFLVSVFIFSGCAKEAQNTSTIKSKASVTAGTYAAYAMTDTSHAEQVNVNVYSIADQKDQTLYSFNWKAEASSPLFSPYGDSILIQRAGQENKNVVLDLTGATTSDFTNPGFFPFVFSADNQKLAYLSGADANKVGAYNLVLRDMASGQEKNIKAGEETVAPGLLTPIVWSADKKFVYADRRQGIEGFPTDLTRINAETLELEKVSQVDALHLVNVKVDASENVYGLRESDIQNSKKPSRFVQLSVPNSTTKEFTVKDATIDNLISVDGEGRYVLFEAAPNGSELSLLWLYDIQKQEGIPLSNAGALIENPVIYNNYVLFQESYENTAGGRDASLRLYDAVKGEFKEITSLQQKSADQQSLLQPIGVFEVAQ